MIKLGAYLIYGEESPIDRLRIVKNVGFDQICFGIETLELSNTSGITPDVCANIGLEIQHLHLTGSKTNLLWSEGVDGDAIADRFCRQIEECRQWGIKRGVLHALYSRNPEPAPIGEVGLSRFKKIAEAAEKNEVILALENSILDEYFCYLLDNIKSDYFKVCYDSGHHHAFGRNIDILARYGDRLAATHLHDNDGARDIHMMPLDGTMDWEEVGRKLSKCPYAHESLVAELGGKTYCQMKDMTAAEIEAVFACAPANVDGLMRFTDGKFSVYDGMSYEEKFARLYQKMRCFADRIEAAE